NDDGSVGGLNDGESVNERSSLTRVTPAVTPLPHETELSRPRRHTKAKALPKPISIGKRQPNKPKSATLTEGEFRDSNDLEPGLTADRKLNKFFSFI
ncbi:unnamed protein product, partial [Strongylus vulgaris]